MEEFQLRARKELEELRYALEADIIRLMRQSIPMRTLQYLSWTRTPTPAIFDSYRSVILPIIFTKPRPRNIPMVFGINIDLMVLQPSKSSTIWIY
jgi:hypothetical protein